MKKNRTVFANNETVKRDWYVVDVAGKTLGRVATRIATYLRGKHKPIFSPQVDCGDYIVVVNAARIRTTGKKAKQKIYFTHSGYPDGHKLLNHEKMMQINPVRVFHLAVAGMLPKGRLGRQMIKKLKVYAGGEHPHAAQKVQKLEV